MTEVQAGTVMADPPPEPADKGKTAYESEGEGCIVGNLTKNPEARFTGEGTILAVLRVAYTPRVRAEGGNGWVDLPTEYYDVTVWRRQAEYVIESLVAGDRVVIVGNWQRQRWTDPNGERKSRLILVATEIGASMLFRQVSIVKPRRGGDK